MFFNFQPFDRAWSADVFISCFEVAASTLVANESVGICAVVVIYFQLAFVATRTQLRVIVHLAVLRAYFRVVFLARPADRHETMAAVLAFPEILARWREGLRTPGADADVVGDLAE